MRGARVRIHGSGLTLRDRRRGSCILFPVSWGESPDKLARGARLGMQGTGLEMVLQKILEIVIDIVAQISDNLSCHEYRKRKHS